MNYPPEVQKRIDRYKGKGYQEIVYAACSECSNFPGNHWRKDSTPIYFNYNSGFLFCTKCGTRWQA